jgi:hypothetical protein
MHVLTILKRQQQIYSFYFNIACASNCITLHICNDCNHLHDDEFSCKCKTNCNSVVKQQYT